MRAARYQKSLRSKVNQYFNTCQTFYLDKDTLNRNISKEKDINSLLREEKLIALFDHDDLFFLKYLLVERAGYNLRNDIANKIMD